MIVLDTSFLVGYHNDRDAHHKAARSVMERIIDGEWGGMLLLEYVFLEIANVLVARRNVAKAVSVCEALLNSREVEFVPCSEYFRESLRVFRNQSKTTLSFADASIVAIARKRNVKHIATFDSDFAAIDGLTVVPEDDSL